MQILVVDDEMVSRTKLETLMETFGHCHSAENGGQALEIFQKALIDGHGFDLIMLDIDMPDMQGTEVLSRIRSMEKKVDDSANHQAVVVMVTAQADEDHVMDSIQSGCNAYITKPFNIDIIRKKLNNLGIIGNDNEERSLPTTDNSVTAETIIKDIILALRKNELRLPAQPQIGIKFRELVHSKADLDEMADLLKKDMVVGSKMIQTANSALYRGYGKVQTVEQAIGRIGLSGTEQLVKTVTSQQLFLSNQSKYRTILHTLWEHSLACAYGAEILGQSLARKFSIDPYMAGLFHDIGALALIDIIAEMEKRGRYNKIEDEAFLETIQSYHDMFGAKLLEKWEFDQDYIHVTLHHNDLESADSLSDELLIVHFANHVAKALGYTPFGQPATVDLIDAPSAEKLKLKEPQIATLQHNVKERMLKLAELSG